jgi:uncharacterized membrane protein
MPEISAFCPGCGRSVKPESAEAPVIQAGVEPLSFDAALGAIAYLTLLPAIVLLLIPQTKRKKFLRFHAWQSIAFVIVSAVIGVLARLLFAGFGLFPFGGYLLGWLLAGVVSLALFFTWVLLVLKAALGEEYELPWIGPLAARFGEAE